MIKPNRVLSGQVWKNIHIDDLNKALIVVGIRAKEDYVATLENTKADLLEALQVALMHFQLVGSGQTGINSNSEMCEIIGEAIRKAER